MCKECKFSFATWVGQDVFSIRMKGSGSQVKNSVRTLVEDFTAPRENDEIDYNFNEDEE